MKKNLKLLISFIIFTIPILSFAQEVRTIDPLEKYDVGQMNVSTINVRLSPGFLGKIEDLIANQTEELKEKQVKLDQINSRRRVTSSTRDEAKEAVTLREKRISILKKSKIDIPVEIQNSVEALFQNRNKGETDITLNIMINSFFMTNGGRVLMVGGKDGIDAYLIILESATGKTIASYNISDLDDYTQGGVIALIVRGFKGRNEMVNHFSEKVANIFYKIEPKKKNDT